MSTELKGKIVVIGLGVYGIGDTLTEALKFAGKPKQFLAYFAPPSAYITDFGQIAYSKDEFAPVLIEKKGARK